MSETNETTNDQMAAAQPVNKPAEETKPGSDLNISDLVAIKNIIEVASTRGAFKPAEFEAVGKTFNKLNAFLDAVANNQKDQS